MHGFLRRWPLLILRGMGLIWGCTPQAAMQQMQSNALALRGMIANPGQQIEALPARVKRLTDADSASRSVHIAVAVEQARFSAALRRKWSSK